MHSFLLTGVVFFFLFFFFLFVCSVFFFFVCVFFFVFFFSHFSFCIHPVLMTKPLIKAHRHGSFISCLVIRTSITPNHPGSMVNI